MLRIRAHAAQAGTHVFRAEVLCSDLEIKLAAEETTRFYADDVPPEGEHTIADQTSVSHRRISSVGAVVCYRPTTPACCARVLTLVAWGTRLYSAPRERRMC